MTKKHYEIALPKVFDRERTLEIVKEVISELKEDDKMLPMGQFLMEPELEHGTNDYSNSFMLNIDHTCGSDEDHNEPACGFYSLEKTLTRKITDRIWDLEDKERKEKEEAEKAEQAEKNDTPEVVNDAPSMPDFGAMGGLGAMLGGMMGSMPNVDPATRAKIAETIEAADNAYWDNHIHYNMLVEAVEEFDRKIVKRIGAITNISELKFESEIRSIADDFQGFFTIGGTVNWASIYEFIKDMRLSLKNELQQYCGYKKIDKDEKKSRDVAPHMKVAQEALWSKIDYAMDRLELEMNLRRGVLPQPTDYNLGKPEGVDFEVNGQKDPEEHIETFPDEQVEIID